MTLESDISGKEDRQGSIKKVGGVAGGMSQKDYYAMMRARLPANHHRASDVISKVNAHYVETGRDAALSDSFSKFVAWVTADQNHDQAGKGDAFYITGESGAGKTDIVEHLIATHPALKVLETPIGPVAPCVSISLPGPATPKVLALRILEEAGYEIEGSKQESLLWKELPQVLQDYGVLFVHIDEFQHMFFAGVDHEAIVEYLKGLMNNTAWPISFIISGMPSVRDIIIHDEQAERRNNSFTLSPIVLPKQRAHVVQIIKEFCVEAGLECKDLVGSDTVQRIAHAANYQFGRICEVVITAIHEAVLAKDSVLTRKHFAQAYAEHSDARGRNNVNPFISKDWARLKAGYYILKPGKKKKDEDDDDQFEV
ncbi:MAG: TniB family NTP-binding protein [Devosia sp.]